MKSLRACSVVALAFVAVSAAAQSQAPGLWEQSVKFKTQSGEMEGAMAKMQERMAAMPPAQRKAMEQAMASHGVAMGAKPNTFRMCITPEEAARKMGPRMSEQPDCTQDVVQRSAGSMKMKWQCTGEHPSSGEGEITFTSDKAYSGKAVVTTTRNGKPETMNIEQSGQWLAADCGAVKPRAQTKP
jgi:hypothetical protein